MTGLRPESCGIPIFKKIEKSREVTHVYDGALITNYSYSVYSIINVKDMIRKGAATVVKTQWERTGNWMLRIESKIVWLEQIGFIEA